MVAVAPPRRDVPPSAAAEARSEPAAARDAVIHVAAVSKSFGEVDVLDRVDLNVAGGQIFGLIGPSGCGKTTLVSILVGLASPNEGDVVVQGEDPADFSSHDRQCIGYTPQGFHLYPTLTVKENARFVGSLYGLGWRAKRRRVREVLTFLELWDARNRLARDISGGMQRRLSLGCALLHAPPLLIVDEPTSGLDPILRIKIWDYLKELRDGGTTIFVTTQNIDEASNCDRLAIMREGRILIEGTPDELRQAALGGELLDIEAPLLGRPEVLALWEVEAVHRVDWPGPGHARVLVDDAGTASPIISRLLEDRGVEVEAIRPHVLTFDEVFVALLEKPKSSQS